MSPATVARAIQTALPIEFGRRELLTGYPRKLPALHIKTNEGYPQIDNAHIPSMTTAMIEMCDQSSEQAPGQIIVFPQGQEAVMSDLSTVSSETLNTASFEVDQLTKGLQGVNPRTMRQLFTATIA